ncbi:MAG: sorbosone dehydrogenase [Gammaproteobacteria bacterium]|nr:MAG: sorbosone dehydrogenase [Gammaproteobacteria bacterium]
MSESPTVAITGRLNQSALLLLATFLMPGPANAAELTLPDGFTAQVFHEGVGARARHIAVRANGDVFVSMRDGELVALRDTNGDGEADELERRKLPISTGLEIHNPFLYFSDTVTVSRLMLDDNLMPAGEPETIVTGFPRQGSHATKSIALNDRGELFVNVGAPSNACQEKRRSPGSPGLEPCPQLERQGAIWKFSASRLDQDQLDGERFVTGTRNVVALDWNDSEQALFFAIHGRDQLSTLWPEYFDDEASAELPAEEFHRAVPGGDYGWPSTFVDPATGKRFLAPEYGGDGIKEAEAGVFEEPLHAYPAHWAPNDLVFYTGDAFPESYHGGAFIAWRGSWNRAPLPQEGYRVTFQPFADGTVAGPPEDFMMGFKGTDNLQRPSNATWRPGGLAVGPDGALYVTEAIEGRIWRVTWSD